MGAATGNRGGLNRNLYEEISLLCVACGGRMRERACRVGGAKPAAGVCVPKCTACCVEIAVGRQRGAATIETTRHYKLNRAPRYYRPRASACRRAPPTEWTSRSAGRWVPQRSSKCAIALWEARARAERPPLWGSDDVSAMRNYRYRHRDSPYVAKRSGERTSRAGRPWAVGGELPGARWRGRPVCAMRPAVQGAAAAQTRACRFFHPHPPSVAARRAPAGRKGGPISSASGYFSSLCWSWGRRARRRRRGAARARRGERHRPCGAARRAVRRA